MKTTKKIVLAAIAGTALLAASGAQARDDHWDHGYRGHHHRHFAPYRVVVRPAPVYYAPVPVYYPQQQVYYPPQPAYYVPPRPMLYGSVPVNPNLNIGFRVRF